MLVGVVWENEDRVSVIKAPDELVVDDLDETLKNVKEYLKGKGRSFTSFKVCEAEINYIKEERHYEM